MKRATSSVMALCLVMSVACGRTEENAALESPATVQDDDTVAAARTMTVAGCLTAAGDRFVLTELGSDAGRAEPTTASYRLIGMDEKLRPLVGQRVEISGTAEPEQVVDIRESSPPAEGAEQPRGTSGADAQVSTVQTTRLEVSDLRVESVRGRGDPCAPSR
jgi:hypothetical protein